MSANYVRQLDPFSSLQLLNDLKRLGSTEMQIIPTDMKCIEDNIRSVEN